MLPLFHGTSTYHYAQMKKIGFLSPRGQRTSTWKEFPSRENLVYFGSVHEQQIPHSSAYNAVEQAKYSIQPYFEAKHEGKKSFYTTDGIECYITHRAKSGIACDPGFHEIPFDFERDLAKIYLRLDDIDKYRRYMVRDEDENWKWLADRSYYLNEKSMLGITFCGRQYDWQLIVVLDSIWYLFDKDENALNKVLSTVPPTIRSFYSNKTIAFSCKIDVNDLRPYTENQFNEVTNELEGKIEKACFESDELNLKIKFSENRIPEKQLVDFIKTVQIPRLKKLLT